MRRCPVCGGRWSGGRHPSCGAPEPDEAAPEPDEPIAVPGHEILGRLGAGGFGTVLRARRAGGGPVVAIKLAHADPAAHERLRHELELLGALGPPHAPAVLDRGQLEDGTPFFAMELIEGPTLGERMARLAGPAAAEEVAALARPIARALAAIHARGIVHRDLKPENVFLAGAPVRGVLVDFGLARIAAPEATQTAAGAGTAFYLAPEQLDGAATPASDVYALGVILYELAAGRPPFCGGDAELRIAHRSHRPAPPREHAAAIPPALEALILECLAKAAERRPPAAELDARLAAACAEAAPAPSLDHAPAPSDPSSRSRVAAAILVFEGAGPPAELAARISAERGQLLGISGGVWAAAFTPIEGPRPVMRASRAADALLGAGLAARALVDRRELVLRTRADGSRHVLTRVHDGARALLDAAGPGRAALTEAARGEHEAAPATRTASSREPSFVGREELRAALRRSARRAADTGIPHRITVVGEDGVGRTRLARELAREAPRAVAGGRAVSIALREPAAGAAFEAVRALAREVLRVPEPAPPDPIAHLERLAGGADRDGAAALASALGWRVPGEALAQLRATPGALRTALARALAAALCAAAAARPLLVIVDDAHFAELAALDAIRIATGAAEARLWICLVSRRPLWDEAGDPRGEVAALPPLGPAEAAALCRELVLPAVDVPEAAIAGLIERTGGLPRDLVDVVRALHAAGAIRERARGGDFVLDTGAIDAGVPPGEWSRRRELATLDPALRLHAAALALLLPGFSEREAEGVLAGVRAAGDAAFELDAGVVLHRLRARGLVERDDRSGAYRLAGAPLRAALAASLAAEVAHRVHAAAARHHAEDAAAADVPDRRARLALHAAASGDAPRAVAISLELADESRDAHDYLGAELLYSRALELLGAGDELELRLRRGRALMRYRLGRYEDSLADSARARDLAGPGGEALVAELLLDEATTLDWMGELGRSAERRDEARRLLGDAPAPRLAARALVAEGRGVWRRSGDLPAAVERLEQALAISEPFADEVYEDRIAAMVMLVFLLPAVGRVGDAEAIAARAIELCERRGDLQHLMAVLANRQVSSTRRGLTERAIADLERADAIGRTLGVPVHRYRSQLSLADLRRRAGDHAGARRHAELAREMELGGSAAGAQQTAAVMLAQIALAQGDLDAARRALDGIDRARLFLEEPILVRGIELAAGDAGGAAWEALLADAERDAPAYLHDVLDQRALAALHRGRRLEARAHLEAALVAARRHDPVAARRLRAALRWLAAELA